MIFLCDNFVKISVTEQYVLRVLTIHGAETLHSSGPESLRILGHGPPELHGPPSTTRTLRNVGPPGLLTQGLTTTPLLFSVFTPHGLP